MPTEPLYACLHCGRSGFTQRGLATHWCSAAPPSQPSTRNPQRPKRLLTPAEIAACKPLATPPPSTP